MGREGARAAWCRGARPALSSSSSAARRKSRRDTALGCALATAIISALCPGVEGVEGGGQEAEGER